MAMTPSTGLGTDAASLAALRNAAARDPKAATVEAAKQFEGLFMQELMKSMRASTLASGLMENEGTQLGTELLDTQFATKLTGRPGGLSELIAKQLERQMGFAGTVNAAAGANATVPTFAGSAAAAAAADGLPGARIDGSIEARIAAASLLPPAAGVAAEPASAPVQRTPLRPPASAQEFVGRHAEGAKSAEAATGIPAAFMIAQAAHETGWGKKEIRMADGSNSFNLFGIKAGGSWKGPVAEVSTTEYVNGKPQKTIARFRAYSSYEESFNDYARLMKESPRYANVVANAGSAQNFAQGLQRAGYATDPAYADKLGRVINTTLRLQRAVS